MKTKLDLITGFLGAGKTTFLRGYMKYLQKKGESFILVENEFGKAGVDAKLLEKQGIPITQLSGGCICCGQKVNFHDLLLELAGQYERILVEPSGIYTLEDFYDIIESPPVAADIEMNAIITIIDMEQVQNLEGYKREVLYSQVAGTGNFLISKMKPEDDQDVVKAQAVDFIQKLLLEYGNDTLVDAKKVISTIWERLTDKEYEAIEHCGYIRNRKNQKKQDHSMLFQSTTVNPIFESYSQLERFLKTVMGGECGKVMRLKGFLSTEDQEIWEINCTPKEWYVVPSKEETTRDIGVNIIGNDIRRDRIKEALRR